MGIKSFIAVLICAVCALTCACLSYFCLFYGDDEDKDIGIFSALLLNVFTALILLIV